MNPQKKIALVIISCDKYSDLWDMFSFFFNKNWSHCPYDKYLISNNITYKSDTFKNIKIGDDKDWSSGVLRVINFLEKKYDYLLLTFEDLPIISKVNQDKIDNIFQIFFGLNGNYLSLRATPKPTHFLNSQFGILEKGSLYRPTTVYSLWKIDTLKNILKKGESPWEFEIYGSIRSEKFSGFYVVNRSVIKMENAIVKGKWLNSILYKLKNLGYSQKNIRRKKFNMFEELIYYLYINITSLFYVFFPWKWRRFILFKIKGYKPYN